MISAPIISVGGVDLFTHHRGSEYSAQTGTTMSVKTGSDLAFEGPNYARSKSVEVEHAIEERSTACFESILTGDYGFEYGQEVIIRDSLDGSIVFGGLIVSAKQTIFSPIAGSLLHTIQVTDYHAIAEGRVFWGAYVSATGGEVARDILVILATEGITEGLIMEGDLLENLKFPHQSCAEALDKIAEMCGYIWFISEDKKLYFIDRAAYPASWNIQDGTEILAGATLELGNKEYRNVIYKGGGKARTDERTEPFAGDGVTKTFPLGYPIAAKPTIKVNGVEQTVGIGQIETGKQWYWNENITNIVQDASETPLTASDLLEVTYIGYFKLMVKAQQAAEITRQKVAMDFGSGYVEKVSMDSSLVTLESALAAAKANLASYATVGKKLVYETFLPGLACGVLQNVVLPIFGLNDDMLITSISIRWGHARRKYSARLALGPVEESWQKFFCGLADAAKKSSMDVAGESDYVQGLEAFAKTWLSSEHPNPFITTYPGETLSSVDVPCLAEEDRLSYLVLYDTDGVEFFRKAVTLQTYSEDGNEIYTTVIVLSEEANGVDIGWVGLWGGNNCSAVAGSGIEMEKHVYSHTKNSLESIQFGFTDTKGW